MNFCWRLRSISLPNFKEALFYLIDLTDIQAEEVAKATDFLDEESLARAQKYVFLEDQQRSILVHACLRLYLQVLINQKASQIKILCDNFGKPYVKDNSIHFNLSHTKQYAFLAFHPNDSIGVDIEKIQNIPNLLSVASRFMHPHEKMQMIKSNDPTDYFFSLWCAKEAFLKAGEIGFDMLTDYNFQADLSPDHLCFFSLNHEIFVYHGLVKSHKLAVCKQRF